MQPQQPASPQPSVPDQPIAPPNPDIQQPLPPQAFVPSYGDPSSSQPQLQPQPPATPNLQPFAQHQAVTAVSNPQAYDFITNPTSRRKPLLVMNSLKQRILIIGVLLVLVLILFAIINKAFHAGGGQVQTALFTVAEQQQELIHLTAPSDPNRQNLSTGTTNLISTLQLTVGSSQQQFLAYLGRAGYKLSATQLQTSFSQTTDADLASAVTAGTYDSTLQSVLKDQISSYELGLKRAYAEEKGPNGRTLLSKFYDQAQLFENQLATPNS